MSIETSRRAPGSAHDQATLVDVLRLRAETSPNDTAYTWLHDGEEEEASWSYAELDARARAIAAKLAEHGATPGDRAVLLFPPGLDFISTFFGCLYAGVVAVPAYPPGENQKASRIAAIFQDCQASFILTSELFAPLVVEAAKQMPGGEAAGVLATDGVDLALAGEWQAPRIDSQSLAFLQYTSGSTSIPKGVRVTHANIVANERMIQEGFGHTPQSDFVGWLPLYHDMGLIGNVFQPLFIGARCVLMSPLDFLQKPIRWLRAISRYQAKTSGAPNFGYELCVRKTRPEDRAGLDLSSWTVAYNGAEPVRAETLERFVEAFSPYGFRAEACYPCYGLAEATLFVTGGPHSDMPVVRQISKSALQRGCVEPHANGSADTQTLVGCGRSWGEQRIAIVDPETCVPRADREIGEIWLAGPHIADGYWNRDEETSQSFGTALAGQSDRRYLRTGDLGFLDDGELFVTGRIKDLIIIRGQNYYPHDLEKTAEQSHAALRPGCGAAFAVNDNGHEQVVILQEVRRGFEDYVAAIAAIRSAILQSHQIACDDVVLLAPQTIPKTSSGKVRRLLARVAYADGRLSHLARERLFAPHHVQPKTENCHENRD